MEGGGKGGGIQGLVVVKYERSESMQRLAAYEALSY
jgi:hypothetical protein